MDSIKRISKDHNSSEDKTLPNENSNDSRCNKSKKMSDEDTRSVKGCIVKTVRIHMKDMVKCFECKKNELVSETFKCFSCKGEKCQKCSEKDCLITKQKLKKSAYICENCFQGHLKFREQIGQEGKEADTDMTLLRKRHRKDAEIFSEENKTSKDQSQNLDHSRIVDIDTIHEIEPYPDGMEFDLVSVPFQLIPKIYEPLRSEYTEVKEFQDPKLEEYKIEKVIEKPQEDIPSLQIATETKHELRKSIRTRNKSVDRENNAINCHQCRKIEPTKNIITCGNEQCRESFCFSCLQKYFQRILNATRFLKMKNTKDGKIWICYKWKGECLCAACKEVRDEESSSKKGNLQKEPEVEIVPNISHTNQNSSPTAMQKSNSRKKIGLSPSKRKHKLRSTKPKKKLTKNIITIPLHENIGGEFPFQNRVEIDDFILYEKESSNAEIEQAQAPEELNIIPENEQKEIDDSYDEYDYNVMNDKKASNKLLQAAHSVENFVNRKYKEHIVIKKCIICNNEGLHANDLLCFKNIDDFLNYLKYAVIYKKNILKSDRDIFRKNKVNILAYLQSYIIKCFHNDWDFKESKIVCKFCFMQYLNSEDCLEKYKKIFVDPPKQAMNITIINSINPQNLTQKKDTPQSLVQHTTNNPTKTSIKSSLTSQPLSKMNMLDKLFISSIQNNSNKETEISSTLVKEKKLEKNTMDEANFPNDFNDKPVCNQSKPNNTSAQLTKLSIPQFFSSYKSFGQANYAVLKTLSELLVSVSNLNMESKEYFPKYSMINSQHIILGQIEEMHKNMLNLYHNVCFHRDNLNKLQTLITVLSNNCEFNSIQSVSQQIKDMLTIVFQEIEDNNSNNLKYDEFIKQIVGGCSRLIMQINDQMQILSFMSIMNSSYENVLMGRNQFMGAVNPLSGRFPIGPYWNPNEDK